MTNRRELLQAGVAAAALPLAVGGIFEPQAEAAAAGLLNIPVYKAIFDERYAECRAFGEHVTRNGGVAHAIADGDITSFWFDELDLLWRETPVAIAGLTQFGPMFVLERFGRERGLHVASCSAPFQGTLVMAAAKPEIDSGTLSSSPIHYYMTHAHREGYDLPLDGPLFSWVIAPKA